MVAWLVPPCKTKSVGAKMIKEIKRKPRCLKLIHRKETHMFGLSNLNAWDNPPIAPPL